MSDTKSLSSLQISIMRVLWAQGEATVTDAHTALQRERGLAATTIATVLTRLEADGLVTHRTEERRYIYRPLVSEAQVRRSMVADLVDRLFQGDPSAMISHLLTESSVDNADLESIRALLKTREQDEHNRKNADG
jgi:BlaI family penicillinase repressor